MQQSQLQPTVLVTGASSGIGLAAAIALARQGCRLIAVGGCRTPLEPALEAIRTSAPEATVEIEAVDLSDLADVRRLAGTVLARHDRLDAIVNVAGRASPAPPSPEGLDAILAANHVGPFLLTTMLLDLLRRSAPSRIITITSSRHGAVKQVPWGALAAGSTAKGTDMYVLSKLANVLFANELARRLEGTGVASIAVDPGFVRTGLGRDARGVFRIFLAAVRPFQSDPAVAGRTIARLASLTDMKGLNGAYFVADGRPGAPSDLARDPEAGRRLWEVTAALTGLARPTRSTDPASQIAN